VYVLSTVQELETIRGIIATSFSTPSHPNATIAAPHEFTDVGGLRGSEAPCAPADDDDDDDERLGPGLPRWTHFQWAQSPTDSDVVVANEVTQRESVLMAISAGLWVVRPEYFLKCREEQRICDIRPFEWTPSMLHTELSKKRANVLLTEGVRWWRELRGRHGLGPFSPPCIGGVALIDLPHSGVLETILRVGGCERVTVISSSTPSGEREATSPAKQTALLQHNVQLTLEMAFQQGSSIPSTSSSPLGETSLGSPHASLFVFLVTAEVWRLWGDSICRWLSEACNAQRQWLKHRQAAAAPAGGTACSAAALGPCAICHYAGHQPAASSRATSTTSEAQRMNQDPRRRQEIAVFTHDWVSLVLQRRKDKLIAPLALEGMDID
jgi:hypothetical protein